ncbi:hypothetical protein HCJ76_44110 [Streptomyces sp. MC1]|uniref:hypothetical protein n=1 Tax=Streptomyces sp. MC1 TaxID=295105 RepID=UPI0018CA8E2A|nr:hypothetical protein [Streptomyces sp. MC1]MBG7704869.1 hypothetical protein [Streptomyces sp. MC1]
MNQHAPLPVASPRTVTVPTHPTGERFSIQLFTVEGTSYGPYVGLPLRSLWTPYSSHLFTRATAEQIVKDLHDHECHMYGEFGPDGTLTIEWTIENDGEGGRKVITPDQWGRYEIGDLWEWDEWQEVIDGEEQPATARLIALGAGEYRQADRSPLLSPAEAAWYLRGRMDAHELTLHLDDTPGSALTAALGEYGVTGIEDDDCGNSWMVFPYALDDDAFDGSGPQVVAYVVADGEDEAFVDRMVGDRDAHWHIATATDAGRETEVLTVPAGEVERVAAFIADLLVVP